MTKFLSTNHIIDKQKVFDIDPYRFVFENFLKPNFIYYTNLECKLILISGN